MKRIITFMYALAEAVATGGGAPVVEIKKPTSAKLTELQNAKKAVWAKLPTVADPESDEAKNLETEMLKISAEIKAEIANIVKTENDAKLAELRAKKLQVVTNYRDAVIAAHDVNNDKKATIEAKNAANDNLTKIEEDLKNQILGSVKLTASANGTAKVSGSKGAENSDILTQHLANVAAGMSDGDSRKALEAAGHARSTVWHTVNNYNKGK